jgi:hypothetical protein
MPWGDGLGKDALGRREEHEYQPRLDSVFRPDIWHPAWDRRFEELYGYDRVRARALLEQAGYT